MIEINNRTRTKIDERGLKDLYAYFAAVFKLKNKELSIGIVGDNVIKKMNCEYRGKDKTTDVLSFEGEEDVLGEIILNPSRIKAQKGIYSQNFNEEFLFIALHGMLHLIGYRDDSEVKRKEMIDLGTRIMDEYLIKTNDKNK